MTPFNRPTLIIDKDICLRNIERMAAKAKEHHLRFRPHFKTHQSTAIGNWFRPFGVEAITVSSVLMAQYFARDGWKDITIAFPLNILEIEEVNRLARTTKLNVLVENPEAAQTLAQKMTAPVGVYIKIDTGSNRTGVNPSKTGVINALLQILAENKKITFNGFLAHNGRTYSARSTNEIFSQHFDSLLKLSALKQKYKASFPEIEVSIGDTPSCTLCSNFKGVDEIRPGNFVFYDLMQQKLGVCDFEDISVRMACPVVAKHASRNEIVIYGGAIHFSHETLTNIDGKQIYGRIIITREGEKKLLSERNYLSRLSQEHGILKVSQSHFGHFEVGDLVEIVPVHACLTANLARGYYTSQGEAIAMINSCPTA